METNVKQRISYNLNYLWKPLICLIAAILLIKFSTLKISSIEGMLSIILLFLILYVIVNSMTSENLSNELPSTLYPSIPHTGLDGISLNSYVAGLDTSKYI
jgi:uncharacterized membrane protein